MATQTQPIQVETQIQEQPAIPEQPSSALEQVLAETNKRSADFEFIQRQAKPLAKAFGIEPEQAIARMMIGDGLGVAGVFAVQQIHLISGKVSMGSSLMLALARNRGWRHTVKTRTDTACVIAWKSPEGELVGESSFSIEEAKKIKMKVEGKDATMADKDNYKNWPSDMCFARAVSRGIRTFCPEITNGIPVYTPEEMQDVTLEPTPKPAIQMPERASTSEPGATA